MADIVREAEELLAGVTPGTWVTTANGLNVKTETTDEMICEDAGESNAIRSRSNADFIAAAPRLVRALLQRLRETEEEKLRLQRYACFSESHVVEHLEEDIRALRAENAKLRAAVKGETFYHSDEAANEEMNRLRAERDEMRKALEGIKEHLRLPAEKRDDGVIYEIADNACDIARKALTQPGEK